MKKLLLLCLAAMLTFTALGESSFTFQGALSWDSNVADVQAWMGDGAAIEEDAVEDYGVAQTVVCDKLTYGTLPCARMSAMFLDGQMAGIFCYFKERDLGSPLDLLDAVAADYGEPDSYGAPDFYGATSLYDTFATWDIDDETLIAIYTFNGSGSRYPYDHCICFEHTPVMEVLSDKMSAYVEMAGG